MLQTVLLLCVVLMGNHCMFVDVQYVSMKKCEQQYMKKYPRKYTKKYTKRYIKKYIMFMKEYSAVLSFQWI